IVEYESAQIRMTFRLQTEHVPHLPFVPVHCRDIGCHAPVSRVISLKSHERNMKNIPAPLRENRIYFKASISCPVVDSKHKAQNKIAAVRERDAAVPESILSEFQINFVFR